MGQFVFRLSDVGEGLAEAEVAACHVGPGDAVLEDQPLIDIVTDKATVELTSPVAGVVSALKVAPGDMAAVGSVLLLIETAAEQPAASPEAKAGPERTQPAPTSPSPTSVFAPRAHDEARGKGVAAPAVRARAKALGIALAGVNGSGDEGRVTHADLDRLLAGRRSAFEPPSASEAVEAVKLVGVRRQTAERMETAKRRIPHFGYVEEIDVTALEALRRELNAGAGERPRLTLLPFLVRALVSVLPEHPQINARYDEEAGMLHRYRCLHLGVAAQTPDGLLVPVLRHAEAYDLWGCATEIARLAQAARERRLPREALSGSTLTLTSLGKLGGVASAPVINWPEVAILAPNRVRERLALREGRVVARQVMNLSTAFDHRVVDGYEAAEFVGKLKARLEAPEGLL